MKFIFIVHLAAACLFGPSPLAAAAESKTKTGFMADRQTASVKDACEQKVRALILQTAKAMGQKENFGFQLSRDKEGVDSLNRPLVSYNASVFIIPEGTVSNSAARAIVRLPDTACEVVKIAVSIGG